VNTEVIREGPVIRVRILHPRLDGNNYIVSALKAAGHISSEIGTVEMDFAKVEYLNSLGITELVTIHRLFQEQSRGKTTFRFLNVDRKIRVILELVEIQKIAEIEPKPAQ